MTLSWNLVAKNINPHAQLQTKIREKVAKLERFLQHFPPDAVHLQIALDRLPKNNRFKVALTLRVPSNILRSEKAAADPIPALDEAIRALLRELSSLKSALRRESQWKRRTRRQALHEAKPARFAPEPMAVGHGPQTFGDVVRELVAEHYGQLLYHIRLQIWRVETEGSIPSHAIDAEAVCDEVARQAIAQAQKDRAPRADRLWLYSLARQELRRRFRDLQERAVNTVPLDGTEIPASVGGNDLDGMGEPGVVPRFPMDDAEIADVTADSHTVTPDAAAAENDLLDFLHQEAQAWPASERSVFELHFLEGFELDEVAMLEKLKMPQVQKLIGQVQDRLRQTLTEATQAKASQLPKRAGDRAGDRVRGARNAARARP